MLKIEMLEADWFSRSACLSWSWAVCQPWILATIRKRRLTAPLLANALLYLGPSGSGKTYVAENFAASINAVWLEADLVYKDGIDALGLRSDWEAFARLQTYEPICSEFDRRAKAKNRQAVVLSLPSFPILTVAHAKLAGDGARIIYLSGTPGQCLDSFLRREKLTGRNLSIEHWCINNHRFFSVLEGSDIKPLIISNFMPDGSYRALDDVFAEIVR